MTALPNRLGHPPYAYVIDCAGAQLQVYARGVATVLRIEGELDAYNADVIGQAIRRFGRLKAPLTLDVSHLKYLGSAGLRALLITIDENRRARLDCAVVGGPALHRLTRLIPDHGLPLVDSIPEGVRPARAGNL
jgi:anti-anti-sigma factor